MRSCFAVHALQLCDNPKCRIIWADVFHFECREAGFATRHITVSAPTHGLAKKCLSARLLPAPVDLCNEPDKTRGILPATAWNDKDGEGSMVVLSLKDNTDNHSLVCEVVNRRCVLSPVNLICQIQHLWHCFVADVVQCERVAESANARKSLEPRVISNHGVEGSLVKLSMLCFGGSFPESVPAYGSTLRGATGSLSGTGIR
jgi:hypothetical protein